MLEYLPWLREYLVLRASGIGNILLRDGCNFRSSAAPAGGAGFHQRSPSRDTPLFVTLSTFSPQL